MKQKVVPVLFDTRSLGSEVAISYDDDAESALKIAPTPLARESTPTACPNIHTINSHCIYFYLFIYLFTVDVVHLVHSGGCSGIFKKKESGEQKPPVGSRDKGPMRGLGSSGKMVKVENTFLRFSSEI